MNLHESLRGWKIALIDDDPWIQNGLRMYFRYIGCHVECFDNATQAIEAMMKEKFDIIVTDYWLSDLDGLAMVSRVKNEQPDALVLLITGYPTPELREEAIRMGVDFLPKPLTIPRLEQSLEALISRTSLAADG